MCQNATAVSPSLLPSSQDTCSNLRVQAGVRVVRLLRQLTGLYVWEEEGSWFARQATTRATKAVRNSVTDGRGFMAAPVRVTRNQATNTRAVIPYEVGKTEFFFFLSY